MSSRALIAVGVAALVASAGADTIDDYVEAERASQRIPGLALAIVREGKLVRARGYGLANVEHEVSAKPETVYQSGSVAKQLTAPAMILLVEDGKVGLDDPISRYLEETPRSWGSPSVTSSLTRPASGTGGTHPISTAVATTPRTSTWPLRRRCPSTSPPRRSGATATRRTSWPASSSTA